MTWTEQAMNVLTACTEYRTSIFHTVVVPLNCWLFLREQSIRKSVLIFRSYKTLKVVSFKTDRVQSMRIFSLKS